MSAVHSLNTKTKKKRGRKIGEEMSNVLKYENNEKLYRGASRNGKIKNEIGDGSKREKKRGSFDLVRCCFRKKMSSVYNRK